MNQKKFICSDADTTVIELEGTEDYIVLACDGMWDGITQEDLPRIVYDYLQKTNGDKSGVAQMLVELAKENGSTDNITVVIVFLRDKIAEPVITPVFSFDKVSNSQGDDEADHVDGKEDCNDSSGKRNNSENSSPNGNTKIDVNQQKDAVDESEEHQQETQDKDNSVKPENTPPLPTDLVLKKEPVFIIEDIVHQTVDDPIAENKPRSPSPSPVCTETEDDKPVEVFSISKAVTPTETVASSVSSVQKTGKSLPDGIGLSAFLSYLPNQGSTISEFTYRLQTNSKPGSVPKSLGPLLEDLPIVSNYVIQEELYKKKELGKKKPKRNKNLKSREQNRDGHYVVPRRGKKKVDGTAPVVWAFAGKNTASVRNHRLTSLRNSQNSSRVILSNILNNGTVDPSIPSQTSSDLKFLEKISKSKHFIESEQQGSEDFPMPHNIFDYPLSTFTASSNLKTKPTSSNKSRSSQATQFKTDPKTVPPFHQSWRPRKLSKINASSVLTEPPPTPFSNVKIHPSSDCPD